MRGDDLGGGEPGLACDLVDVGPVVAHGDLDHARPGRGHRAVSSEGRGPDRAGQVGEVGRAPGDDEQRAGCRHEVVDVAPHALTGVDQWAERGVEGEHGVEVVGLDEPGGLAHRQEPDVDAPLLLAGGRRTRRTYFAKGAMFTPASVSGSAHRASHLDGAGRVAVGADGVGVHLDVGAVDRGDAALGHEPHHALGHLTRVMEDGTGLTARHQRTLRRVGTVGERLGHGAQPGRLAPGAGTPSRAAP